MKKVIRALASAVALAIILVAIPWLIVAWGEWARLGELVRNPRLLLVPDDGHVVLAILTALGALFWFVLAWSVLLEAVDAVRSRHSAERARPKGWLKLPRGLVRPLVVAAFAIAAISSTLPAAADPAPGPAQTAPAWTQEDLEPGDTAVPAATDGLEDNMYVVAPGDSLWSIAETMYGDGLRWPAIAQANQQLLDDSDVLQVGWRLRIPVLPHRTEQDKTVTVAPGQSLWAIAEQTLGDGASWPAIADANRDLIADPAVIEPGWELVIPAGPADGPDTQGPADVPPTPPPQPPPPATPPPATAHPVSAPVSGIVPDSGTDDMAAVVGRAIGVSAMVAGGLTLLVRRRRVIQLRSRPVGRRIARPPDTAVALEAALSLVGASSAHASALARLDTPVNEGILVCLGEDSDDKPVFADVGGSKPFLVYGRPEPLAAVMSGITMNLAIEEGAGDCDQHIVSRSDLFATMDSCSLWDDFGEALRSMTATVRARRSHLGNNDWTLLRDDPNHADAWRPVVYCFVDPVSLAGLEAIAEALRGTETGVAAVAAAVLDDAGQAAALVSGSLHVTDPGRALLLPQHTFIQPVKLEPSAALVDLLDSSVDSTTSTGWWSAEDEYRTLSPQISAAGVPANPPPISVLTPAEREPGLAIGTTFHHPALMMLGPIRLEGARGTAPERAERACMEYCAWLLQHPGQTAPVMAQSLLVAETTRRSNVSRLRTWLGQDPDGNSYLPEAYSGRICLDPVVSSDWERLCLLISGGIGSTATDNLIFALRLVRGVPLEDAPPGQWHWAEQLRTDMISVIRDIGVLAVERCLEAGDIGAARWAGKRALMAAPEDELLLCARIRTEHAAGNRIEVERLSSWLTRSARDNGVDLLPQSLDTLLMVMTRRAPDPIGSELDPGVEPRGGGPNLPGYAQ